MIGERDILAKHPRDVNRKLVNNLEFFIFKTGQKCGAGSTQPSCLWRKNKNFFGRS